MRKDKASAIRLRKQGKSYNEINKVLSIPKGTLSGWFSDDLASKKIKDILMKQSYSNAERVKKFVATNRDRWEKWREEARMEARKEFGKLSRSSLFVAGIMLYWAEGDNKIKNRCKITNTDPRMMKLYIKFLTDVLQLPKNKIRVALILYPDLKEDLCMNFWSKYLHISKGQFYKTQVIKGKHPTARLSNGICMIYCGGRQLKEKIMVWVDLLSSFV